MRSGPGTPWKKTVQTDLPRQSTVESGTKPPKLILIKITVQNTVGTEVI